MHVDSNLKKTLFSEVVLKPLKSLKNTLIENIKHRII